MYFIYRSIDKKKYRADLNNEDSIHLKPWSISLVSVAKVEYFLHTMSSRYWVVHISLIVNGTIKIRFWLIFSIFFTAGSIESIFLNNFRF